MVRFTTLFQKQNHKNVNVLQKHTLFVGQVFVWGLAIDSTECGGRSVVVCFNYLVLFCKIDEQLENRELELDNVPNILKKHGALMK